MFGQVLSGGYIRQLLRQSTLQQEDFFPDFEAQITPAAILPVNTVILKSKDINNISSYEL